MPVFTLHQRQMVSGVLSQHTDTYGPKNVNDEKLDAVHDTVRRVQSIMGTLWNSGDWSVWERGEYKFTNVKETPEGAQFDLIGTMYQYRFFVEGPVFMGGPW